MLQARPRLLSVLRANPASLAWLPVATISAAMGLSTPALAQVAIIEVPQQAPAQSVQPAPAQSTPALPEPQRELTQDEQIMLSVRTLLSEGKPSEAEKALNRWIETRLATIDGPHPLAPEALYLRGNARLAQDEEYDALLDYEQVVNNFPGSEFFARALERELDVARLYLNGRRRPTLWGLRIDTGVPLAEEIIIRIGERLPGSTLAEDAILELGDYYARTGDMRSASTLYDTHLAIYPRSPRRALAMQRLIYSSIAQFKGPRYDTSRLKEAQAQLDRMQGEFPALSERTGMNDALAARIDESAAATLLETARWYVKRDDPVSARLVVQRLVTRHPRSGAAQEGVALLEGLREALPTPTTPTTNIAPGTREP